MELIAVIFVIALILLLGIPAIRVSIHRARVAACGNNLAQIWKMLNIYRSQFGRPGWPTQRLTGGALWRVLETTNPPLLDSSNAEIFLCPVKGDGRIGDLEYWGPGKGVSILKDMEPVGSDAMSPEPNHGLKGGNLLRKSGDVRTVLRDGEEHQGALRSTKR